MPDSEDAALVERFDRGMEDVYRRAGGACKYWANRYLQQLRRDGGLNTAHRLLELPASTGLERLVECRRPDLSVEALVLRREFAPLFNADERAEAGARLAEALQQMLG